MDQTNANKRIALNTLVLYVRMFIITVIGLFTTRYILSALGESDYGLYSVLGGILALLNMLSVAMYTTTRRYINIEMGKPDGNLNRIFNVCLMLHICFALLTFLIAESVGVFYISHYLNVAPEKLSDAYFVFHISTFVSMLGLINVPYQGLLNAYERFNQIAFIEVIAALLKIPLIICLVHYQGNALRFYAVGMCAISLVTFLYYQILSYLKYHDVVRFKIYKERGLYRSILVFNNYTAMGALSWMARSQGANVLVNFFFGTIVNAAFAIAYNIETYVQMFVSNASQSFVPQITQNYSAGNMERCYTLMKKNARYATLIIVFLAFPLFVNIQWVLHMWIGEFPKHADVLCQLILINLVVRSIGECFTSYVQASGKVKWFQIWGSLFSLMSLPIAYALYGWGTPYYTVILVYLTMDLFNKLRSYYLVYRILEINPIPFVLDAAVPVLKTLVVLAVVGYFIVNAHVEGIAAGFVSAVLSTLVSMAACILIGLKRDEQTFLLSKAKVALHKIVNRK